MRTFWLLLLLGSLLPVRATELTDPARFTQDSLPAPAAPQDSLRQLEAEYFAFEEQLVREGRKHTSNVPAQPGPERCVYEIYRSLTTPEVCETYFRNRILRRRYGDRMFTEPYGFSAEPRGCYFIPQDSIVYALLPSDQTLAEAIRLIHRYEELYLDPDDARDSVKRQECRALRDSLPLYVQYCGDEQYLPTMQSIAPFRPETGLPAERILYLPDHRKQGIQTFSDAFFRKYGTLTGQKYEPHPESATERRSRELLSRLGVECEHTYESGWGELLETFYNPGVRIDYVLLESGMKRACVQLDDKKGVWAVILVRETDTWRIAAAYCVAEWVLFR